MADMRLFLPGTIIGMVASGGPAKAFSIEDGTILFCDVAGFTPLTEALSGMGKEGAEELTKILNSYFTEMIMIVDEAGGDVIRFGGDAMTIFFRKGMESRAAMAAHLMMQRMDTFREVRAGGASFTLAMKIGAAYGKVIVGVIGDEGSGMDYYAAGLPLDHSAEAEHRASKGMIVFHPTFGEVYGGGTIPLGDGFGESRELPRNLPPRESGGAEDLSVAGPAIARLVPRHIVERAGEGTLGEHRGTTVIFLGFEGPAPGEAPEAAKKFHDDLDRFFLHLASAVRNYGGIINKVDMGDKGMKAILLFGSPYALENKEEMAIRCAVEVRDGNPMKDRFRLKMGITTSALFTGPVGSPTRREFTVMGDGINTAARLMQKAGFDEIYCDERTAELTRSSVIFRALEPLTLKGKEKPVPVFTPEGFAGRGGRFELPVIIEREDVLEKIKNLLMRKTKPLLIAGEAGAGKTVLIEWARRESLALDMTTTRIFLAPYHRTRAYSLWRGALRSLIGAGKEDSPEKVRGMRDAILDKGSREYGALLDPILGLEGEGGGSFGSLSPRERKELTFAVAEKLIHGGGERFILADNLEWADPLSLDLLNFLYQGGSDIPIKFMASCRSVSADLEKVSGHFDCHSLQTFSDEGTRSHLRQNLRLETASPNLLEWFRSKAGGNPKLIGAMFQILREKNILTDEGGKCSVDEDRLFSTPFPERLEDIYLGKIDELPREEREIVQAASVLGYSVSLFLLSMASDRKLGDARRCAESLVSKGIFRSDSWSERPYFRFADNLLRDAVYNALPFSLKRDAHLKCALFLEKDGAGKPGLYPLIAGHFTGAGDTERANIYNKKSAYDALNRFDNLTAMRFLEEVCGGGVSGGNIECAFSLVEVYGNLGRAGEEVGLISRIEALGDIPGTENRLRLLSFLAKKAIMERNAKKAEDLFLASEQMALREKNLFALAKIYVNKAGGLYGPRGELDKAKEELDKCLALPDKREIAVLKVTALFNNANIMKHKGEDEEALRVFKKAYRKAARMKMLPQMANVAVNIAIHLYELRRFRDSLAWSARTKKLAGTIGLRQLLLYNDRLYSIIEHSLGRSGRAEERLKKNYDKCGRYNNQHASALTAQALMEVEFSLLNVKESILCGKKALELFNELGDSITFSETMVEMLKLLHALNCREDDQEMKMLGGLMDARRASPDILGLAVAYRKFFEGGAVKYDMKVLDTLKEGYRVDYLLLCAEECIKRQRTGEAREIMDVVLSGRETANVDLKTKIFLFLSLMGDERAGAYKREVALRLRDNPLGIYGSRSLALLWQGEISKRRKLELRSMFISRLYLFRANSPQWAFERLLGHDEIRKAFIGLS